MDVRAIDHDAANNQANNRSVVVWSSGQLLPVVGVESRRV